MNKKSAEYKRAKESLIVVLKQHCDKEPFCGCNYYDNLVGQIFSINGMAIEADDQSLSEDFSIAEFGLGDPLFDIDSIKEANFRKVV